MAAGFWLTGWPIVTVWSCYQEFLSSFAAEGFNRLVSKADDPCLVKRPRFSQWEKGFSPQPPQQHTNAWNQGICEPDPHDNNGRIYIWNLFLLLILVKAKQCPPGIVNPSLTDPVLREPVKNDLPFLRSRSVLRV